MMEELNSVFVIRDHCAHSTAESRLQQDERNPSFLLCDELEHNLLARTCKLLKLLV